MALNSTMIRFEIELSNVDEGVYQQLDFRVAQHPSEAVPFLLTRVLAYTLNYQEGIEFTGGIATPDEPAISVRDLTGTRRLWIDIGSPSARRLHKASKSAAQVRVYTHHDPQILFDDAKGVDIYRRESIEIFSVPAPLLQALGEGLARTNRWKMLITEGELSITVNGATVFSELTLCPWNK